VCVIDVMQSATTALTTTSEWRTLLDAATTCDVTMPTHDIDGVNALLDLVSKHENVPAARENVSTTAAAEASTTMSLSVTLATPVSPATIPAAAAAAAAAAALVIRHTTLTLECVDALLACRRACGWYRKSQYRIALLVVRSEQVQTTIVLVSL
jgi:hypothetical protein